MSEMPGASRFAWRCAGALLAIGVIGAAKPAAAHNPIFTPGPHVVYQGGLEVTIGYVRDRASGAGETETEQEIELELEYGLTADWTAEIELPYLDKDVNDDGSSGLGDIVLRSRYRFLRLDTPGVQRSAAVLAQVKLPTGDDDGSPRLGSGSTDFVGGLLYGHESRRWYYNLAARYRLNTEGGDGLEKGDRQFLDLVGGVRPVLTGYLEPDAVVFLELNWENAGRDERNGVTLGDTGGWELFLSPGLFATYRNVALRTGVQIPIAENLDGNQPTSDYRFKFELKYTF
jgi:hypothetical protein